MSVEPGWGQGLISANGRIAVILSAAKDLRTAQREILRCAQDDSSAEVNAYEACPRPGILYTP
jgi:hypothetical protein